MTNQETRLGAFWCVSRLSTVLPYSLILVVIALSLVTPYPSISLVIGIGTLLLSLIGSNLINALYDIEFDKLSRYKRHVAQALEKMGIRITFWLSYGLPTVAILLSLLISPWHALLIGAWNILSIIDAAPPLRIKERGIIRYLAFGLAQVLLFLFFYEIFATELGISALVVGYLVGSISVSVAMVHEALDVYSDSSVGLRTSVVRLSTDTFLKIAWIVAVSAVVLSIFIPVATFVIFLYSEKLRRLRFRVRRLPMKQQENVLNRTWSTSKNGLLAMSGLLVGTAFARLDISFFYI